jgi:hypothetical protein|tara:strand:+ start:74 stop:187 length:114 start_codon:yes stop_codon:yes gene_type:complete
MKYGTTLAKKKRHQKAIKKIARNNKKPRNFIFLFLTN